MARVTGIGGFFFAAQDPAGIVAWYAEHLGIVLPDSRSYDDPGWFQDRGETVVAAFPQGSDFFGAPGNRWKLNLRVDDLDGMAAALRASGIAVQVHDEVYPNGRFAELEDPEGNGIQLWEPNAASLARDPGPG